MARASLYPLYRANIGSLLRAEYRTEGAVRGLRISVGNLKLPDFQSRKPETSGENRAAQPATNQNPRTIFFLVCRYARSPGLAARQSTPAFDAAIYYPNSTSYQLQSSFYTCPTEPEPTARAPSKCPIDLFGPVSNRTILKRLHGASRCSSRNPRLPGADGSWGPQPETSGARFREPET